jgi:hypothetical protein
MKTEEIKKQEELNDEQLDNVAGAGILKKIIKKTVDTVKDVNDTVNDVAKDVFDTAIDATK